MTEMTVSRKTGITVELAITIISFAVILTTTYRHQTERLDNFERELEINRKSIEKIDSSLHSIDEKLMALLQANKVQEAIAAYGLRDRWSAGCMTEYDIELVKQLKEAGVEIEFSNIRDIQNNNGFGPAQSK